mgnify:CR=1 FL=1
MGDAVTVKVLRVDQEKGRISLSLKALEGDPWGAVAGRLRERQVVRGRAVRSTEFGIFVELLPGVDGLLHVTEIPRSRQGALREAAAASAEIAVLIVSIDRDEARASRSRWRRRALELRAADAVERRGSERCSPAPWSATSPSASSFASGPGQTGLVPTGRAVHEPRRRRAQGLPGPGAR